MRARATLVLAAAALAGCDLGSDGPARKPAPRAATPAQTPTASATPAAASSSLVERLRRGGYVLVFRHAATNFSMTDESREDLSDCARQRNLSAEGRRQARALGGAIRRLGVPVGRVLASPYCRTRDTARLAFGRARPSAALVSGRYLPGAAARERQPERLLRLLAAPPVAGTNTVLVSHTFAVDDATGVGLAEGEAAVFDPGTREAVATVAPEDWTRLARSARAPRVRLREYRVFAGARPHDVAPAPDGSVWFTAQGAGEMGRLDPRTGKVRRVPLGAGSAPHGVIVGPGHAAWVTDGGLNAIVRVDDRTHHVRRFPLPASHPSANLNTATFDRRGRLWFTGQAGVYGMLDPRSGRVRVWDAPRGPGPYGIATTPSGAVWYASLAGSHVARIDLASGTARPLDPPTAGQGARRVWADSRGRLWISEWNAGKVGVYDPRTKRWREWRLPGSDPMPYAVYVDETDRVWLTDFGANALVRFDPERERFDTFPLKAPAANVRQLLGRAGEVWGAESGADRLVVATW